MVQHINGYACNNPAQVALARRGVDPAAVTQAPRAPGAAAQAQPSTQNSLSTADSSRTGRGRFVDLVA